MFLLESRSYNELLENGVRPSSSWAYAKDSKLLENREIVAFAQPTRKAIGRALAALSRAMGGSTFGSLACKGRVPPLHVKRPDCQKKKMIGGQKNQILCLQNGTRKGHDPECKHTGETSIQPLSRRFSRYSFLVHSIGGPAGCCVSQSDIE